MNRAGRASSIGRSLCFWGTVIFFYYIAAAGFVVHAAEDAYVSAGTGDARILIPFLADDMSSGSVCSLIYNGLTRIDRDMNIVGDLAENWDISDGGKVITFHLRRGVKWHDGEEFTAKDVKFTYETILSPEVACPYVSNYTDISGIDVIDDYTVRFTYLNSYSPALLKFGMGIIPEHLFSGISDIRTSIYARSPIGTGPYMFSRWRSGQYIVLEYNPYYFVHVPNIGKYVYRIIPDQSVQFLELISGGIDSMDLNPYQFLYRSDTPEFKSRIEKYKYLSHSYTYVGYNLADTMLSDRRVREALSRAINKEEIISAALLGLGEVCTGPFLKGTPYYDMSVKGYEYDPGFSARLLREAGWADIDGDGVLEKEGRELVVKIATNQGNQVREDVATIIQEQWSNIGVRTEIQIVAWAAFLDQFIGKRDFQVVIMGWTIPMDPDVFSVWHSDSMSQGGLNFISYSNPEVDHLIEEGRREFDREKRGSIYRQIHRLISGDIAYTFLFFPYATPAVEKRFRGIVPAPAGIDYNFIDWYVPVGEVKYKL